MNILKRNKRIVMIAVVLVAVLVAGTFSGGFGFFIDYVLHLDVHLGEIIAAYGAVTYAILFVIVFVETGLVFVPFLPGDSLLFVAGTFAASGSLNVWLLTVLLSVAAVLGDTANYWIGKIFGERIVASPRLRVNKNDIERTQRFFEKHGSKTIVLARFVPVIRTFAPFVAGAGRMRYGKFLFYNVTGGILWVLVGIIAGYFFGNIPLVKNNFTVCTISIVLISSIPIFITFWREKRKKQITGLPETGEPN